MTLFISIAVVLLIASWFMYGFSIATIVATIATGMFIGRLYDYKKEAKVLIVMEAIATFITVIWSMLMNHFVLWKVIVYLILRAIFLAMVYYDDVEYVYVQRIERREEDQK